MDEQRQKAFEFAQDLAKQLITISTAVIAVSITYGKDFAKHAEGVNRKFIVGSWAFLLVSILFGLWTLMALTGNLEEASSSGETPSIRTRNVTAPAIAQVLCFLVGMLLAVLFGIYAE